MSLRDRFADRQKRNMEEDNAKEEDTRPKLDLGYVFQIETRPDPAQITLKDLYPFGEPHYSLKAPEADASYLYQHTIVCPVCHEKITINALSGIRLRLQKIDRDLRKRYRDIEPLWYKVWHCPNCYYAAFEEQFEKCPDISHRTEEVIKGMSVFKDAKVLKYSEPRTIDQVLTSMYLALQWAQFWDADYTIRPKLWLYLSWLYSDLGDEELYLKTTEKALEYYRRMYYTSSKEFDPAVEQACFLVIAELFIRLGDLNNAYDCLRHVALLKTGKRVYMLDAQNRLSDVREMIHEKDEED